MKPFRTRRRGRVFASFEAPEAELLATFSDQLVELLSERSGPRESDADPLFAQLDGDGPRSAPEDPVLARLLPDAYGQPDDAEDASEFRRFTERSLSAGKIANARTVVQSLERGGLDRDRAPGRPGPAVEVELDAEAQQAWLRWLTDVRLSLAVRLGITDDEDDDLGPDDPGVDETAEAMREIYDWLGYVQETLVLALP